MVIGQDWGCEEELKTLIKNKGIERNMETNLNLVDLFKNLCNNYHIKCPEDKSLNAEPKPKLFFHNPVLGIRHGDSNSNAKSSIIKYTDKDIRECYCKTEKFLKNLIEIISPLYIIALGGHAYNALRKINTELIPKTISKLVGDNGKHPNIRNSKLFVVYHPKCRPINRTNKQQINDWKKIKEYMDKDNSCKE